MRGQIKSNKNGLYVKVKRSKNFAIIDVTSLYNEFSVSHFSLPNANAKELKIMIAFRKNKRCGFNLCFARTMNNEREINLTLHYTNFT